MLSAALRALHDYIYINETSQGFNKILNRNLFRSCSYVFDLPHDMLYRIQQRWNDAIPTRVLIHLYRHIDICVWYFIFNVLSIYVKTKNQHYQTIKTSNCKTTYYG